MIDGLRKRLSKASMGGASIGAGTIFQTVIMLAGAGSGITLARSLGPSGRGELAIAILWTGILVFLGDLGLGFAFSFYAGKFRDTLNELWTLALLVGLFFGASIALLGWLVVPHFVPALQGSARLGFGIALYSVPMVLTGGYQAYLLLGAGFVGDYNSVRAVAGVSYLVLVFVFALLGWNTVSSFAITYVLAQLCGLILSSALIVVRLRPRLRFRADLVCPVFTYGLKTQLASMASQINLRADQTVMSLMLPAADLGLYAVAVTVSGVVSPLLNALAIVIMPRTIQAASARHGAILVAQHVRVACYLALPVVTISVILLPWVLPAVFGKEFAPAVFCGQILMVAGLFSGINMVLNNSLRGMGRAGMPAIAESAGMLGTIGLLYVLLPRFGIVGAAMTSLAAYAAVALLQFRFVAQAGNLGVAELASTPLDRSLFGRAREMAQALVRR